MGGGLGPSVAPDLPMISCLFLTHTRSLSFHLFSLYLSLSLALTLTLQRQLMPRQLEPEWSTLATISSHNPYVMNNMLC